MKKHSRKIVILLTFVTAMNIIVAGTVYAQMSRSQQANIAVNRGTLYLKHVPASIDFPKTVVAPNQPKTVPQDQNVTVVYEPTDAYHRIEIFDEGTGDTFSLEATLQNLVSPDNDVIRYDNVGMITQTQNPASSVDANQPNVPIGPNNIEGPLNVVNSNGESANDLPDSDFSLGRFPLNTADPNPDDPTAESLPVVMMQRTTAAPDSIGDYSLSPGFRVKIPANTPIKPFTSVLTVTLTTPLP